MATAFEVALETNRLDRGRSRARKNPVSGGAVALGAVVLVAVAGGAYLLFHKGSGTSGGGAPAPKTIQVDQSNITGVQANVGDTIVVDLSHLNLPSSVVLNSLTAGATGSVSTAGVSGLVYSFKAASIGPGTIVFSFNVGVGPIPVLTIPVTVS